jgi:hypothetical protein
MKIFIGNIKKKKIAPKKFQNFKICAKSFKISDLHQKF